MRALLSLATTAVLACACATPGYSSPGEGRAAHGPFQLEVTDPSGAPLRTFASGGRTYVLGAEGQRYRIRVRNESRRRIEAVVSIDGRDALDGKPARSDNPGYLVPAHGEVLIDGFRLSTQDVATFRFSSVADSYAAQTGNARHVGVIGVAVFEERYREPPHRHRHRPRHYEDDDRGRAPEERDEAPTADSRDEQGAQREAPRSEPAPAPPRSEAKAAAKSAGADSRREGRAADAPPRERPGLGTAFGERRVSEVEHVYFERASPGRPDAVLSLRYNDRRGLLALGIDLRPPRRWPDERELWRRETARPFADLPSSYAAPPAGWRGDR